jgi:predicted amidohydrolase
MRIALAQFSPHLGDIERNLAFHLECAEESVKEKTDLLVFPELSLTGYNLRDMVQDVAMDATTAPAFRRLKSLSRRISLVVGFVEESRAEKGLFYNSAAFLSKGKILHIHRKVFLPTFGMFEEGRFFAQGRSFETFATPFGKAGLMICRDFTQYGAGYLLFSGGAEIIIVISAAPGRGITEKEAFDSCHMWELMGEAIAYFSGVFVIYCNRIGVEDGVTFAGGSFIFTPFGKLLGLASYLDEELLTCSLREADVRDARRKLPFKRDDRPEIILHGLQRILDENKS